MTDITIYDVLSVQIFLGVEANPFHLYVKQAEVSGYTYYLVSLP